MKTKLILLTAFAFFQNAMLNPDDFDSMTGKKWTGTLTYLDYTTNKPEVIETELTVAHSIKGAGIYNFYTTYPKEASHNSTDETVISKDGKYIDDELVKERTLLSDGTLRFVTTKNGKDNNRNAAYRFTYLIGKTSYSRKKEVCYTGSSSWFTRNELNLKNN
ncbi:hypothetical protein [Mucilaginibacter flavidus]|uniref:hypothetical protein n=1 Tax=Mucilaginibacter flavidus TaxID=2949309 RepID=UPI002093C4A2|nr:hypothetical protein [Mucilaginibacter flavidus]MCO5948002.1 hypothetical protein [Mucilaginibacter flavidus]